MIDCIVCKLEVPVSSAAYWTDSCRSVMHIGCAESEHEFINVCLDGTCCTVEKRHVSDMIENDTELTQTPVKMTWAQYYSMPEFTGF